MVTEGQPTDLVKVLHLLVMSFSWGMQVWVSFIAGMKHKNSHESCHPVSAPPVTIFLISVVFACRFYTGSTGHEAHFWPGAE